MAHTITRVDCNTITIENLDGVNDMTYSIEELQDDKTFLEVTAATTILASATASIDFPNDGVFKLITTENGPVVTNYTHVIYCAVQTCMLNMINETMFASTSCTCSTCFDIHDQKHYLYNQIKLTFYSFLASLNTQYVDNETYATLDPHDLEDLYFISQMIDKMTEYCECADALDSATCNC